MGGRQEKDEKGEFRMMQERAERCTRNTGLDALRIVAMFLITLGHILGQGGYWSRFPEIPFHMGLPYY